MSHISEYRLHQQKNAVANRLRKFTPRFFAAQLRCRIRAHCQRVRIVVIIFGIFLTVSIKPLIRTGLIKKQKSEILGNLSDWVLIR